MHPLILLVICLVGFYSLKSVNIIQYPANIIVPILLVVLFTPGLLFTIPPGSKGFFMSGQSSIEAVLVHSVIVAGIYYFLIDKYKQYY